MICLIDVCDDGQLAHQIYRFLKFVKISRQIPIEVISPCFETYLHYFEPLYQLTSLAYSPLTESTFSEGIQLATTSLLSLYKTEIFGSHYEKRKNILLSANLTSQSDPLDNVKLHIISSYISTHEQQVTSTWLPSDIKSAEEIINFLESCLPSDVIYSNLGSFQSINKFDEYALNLGRKLFIPRSDAVERQSEWIKKTKKDIDILIGVHIRHGDYRTWHGGEHYYTTQEYFETILATEKLFPGKKVRFIIASNETQNLSSFPNIDVMFAPNDIIDDLYILAECDYLIGTQSGYVFWASQYKCKPLYTMKKNPDKNISLEDFKKINYL